MRNFVLLLCLLLILSGCGSSPDSQKSDYRQITMEDAAKLMQEENDYVILDVRTTAEFQDGHIPDAVNVPNETIGEADISELPDKEQLILVYCRSGNRSKQASEKLVTLGYTNIVEIGGINDWTGEIISGRNCSVPS